MRLLDAACSTAWAITPDALRVILDIADRQEVAPAVIEAAMHGTPEAVAARVGRPLDNARSVEVRAGIAVIPVEGPIFRYANLFTEVSGATSVQVLARDLHVALDDPKVTGILLHVDSPGGEASGLGELAAMIRSGTERKPITAYVSTYGASGGYWLASAAGRIVAAETAILGSIGVVYATRDPRKDKSKDIEFVSSQSPNKRPDPNTPGGQDQYQALVDDLADVFIADIARYRGVKPQTVIEDFGSGGVMVGRKAVEAGMADAIGSYESTLAEMQAQHQRAEKAAARKQQRAAATAVAPIAAPARPARGGRMGMRERFFAWLDGMDVEASVDSEQEGRPMPEQHTDASTRPAPVPAPVIATEAQPVAASARSDADQVRLAELQAEVRRLRAERINDRAQAFAAEQVHGMKAFPAEQAALVALYAQAAADDEQFGPAGDTTRATLLATLLASRPAASQLTAESLAPAVAEVLHNRASAPDRNAPADGARLNELLSMTPLGATLLNGKGN